MTRARRAPPEAPDETAGLPLSTALPARSRPANWRWAPRASRVFVNRNLRLDSIGAIGFDLDHTLAHYDPPPVERLAFEATLGKLVSGGWFGEEILELRYHPASVIRGLVVDRTRGNLLKTDYFNYVTRAYHGERLLTSEERKRFYRLRRIRIATESYVSMDTLFHLPEALLYQRLVDHVDAHRSAQRADYSHLYGIIRTSIDQAHADGTIKRVIMAERPRFLRPDPQLPAVLEKLRASGKKLFLLTNSEAYYTDALLSHLLGDGTGERRRWQDYFDLIVVEARKPAFFLPGARGRTRPRRIDGGGQPPVYEGGNARFLEDHLGFRGDHVLYFGDHTYGDILRSKKTLGWRTAMIVPELTHEIAVTESIQSDLELLGAEAPEREMLETRLGLLQREATRLERTQLESAGGHPAGGRNLAARLEIIRRERRRAEEGLAAIVREHEELEERCEAAYNPRWGPLFRAGKETSRFGHQVKDFACIYMARVSCLLHYPDNHYFQSPVDLMPHEL